VPEIGTPGLMSGDGKRGAGHRPQATAPILDSTNCDIRAIYDSAKAGTKKPRTMPGLKVCWRLELDQYLPMAGPPQLHGNSGLAPKIQPDAVSRVGQNQAIRR